MKIIQCMNYHYYDSEKYNTCPYCIAEQGEPDEGFQIRGNGDKTRSFQADEGEPTMSFSELSGAWDEKTMGMNDIPGQMNKVTGWLVCIEGVQQGRAYQIGYGRNFIGRSLDMDICFSEDLSVSRQCHGEIVFDDSAGTFYVVPGSGVIILDGNILEKPEYLKEDMILEIGDGKYCFVPYCTQKRGWK